MQKINKDTDLSFLTNVKIHRDHLFEDYGIIIYAMPNLFLKENYLVLDITVDFAKEYSYAEIDMVMEKIVPILSDNNKHKIKLAKSLIRHKKDKKIFSA